MTTTLDASAPETAELERILQARLLGRVRHLRVLIQNNGIILQGSVPSYHAKQVVQHAIMQASRLPILANEICVNST